MALTVHHRGVTLAGNIPWYNLSNGGKGVPYRGMDWTGGGPRGPALFGYLKNIEPKKVKVTRRSASPPRKHLPNSPLTHYAAAQISRGRRTDAFRYIVPFGTADFLRAPCAAGRPARWAPSSRPAFLAEAKPCGTVIGHLSCVGAIGVPVFSLIDNAGGRVALSGNTVLAGLVSSNYDTTPFFNFAVSIDGIDPQLPNVLFTVYVLDAATHPPVIISNGAGNIASISINENTTAVTTVVATDADVGAGSVVT